jgi:hypothetical protein
MRLLGWGSGSAEKLQIVKNVGSTWFGTLRTPRDLKSKPLIRRCLAHRDPDGNLLRLVPILSPNFVASSCV